MAGYGARPAPGRRRALHGPGPVRGRAGLLQRDGRRRGAVHGPPRRDVAVQGPGRPRLRASRRGLRPALRPAARRERRRRRRAAR